MKVRRRTLLLNPVDDDTTVPFIKKFFLSQMKSLVKIQRNVKQNLSHEGITS